MKKYILPVLLFTVIAGGCKKQHSDDDHAHDENELITTVFVQLADSATSDSVYGGWSQPLGPGTAVEFDTLYLSKNAVYRGAISFLDESKKPPVDLTSEIKGEANAHRVVYQSGKPGVRLTVTDFDSQNPPMELGIKYTIRTDSVAFSDGMLRVNLRHYTSSSPKTSGIGAGTSDLDVLIPYQVK